jgi:uncharacterized protein involved in oxidation of intracellular sulfur
MIPGAVIFWRNGNVARPWWRFPGEHEAAMKILIIISTNDPELKWNALRFGNVALERGDEVTIFLNGPAVDLTAGESPRFPLSEQAKLFTLSEGVLAA